MPPERQLRLDGRLECDRAQPLEARDRVLGERGVGEVRQCVAAPESECGAQARGRASVRAFRECRLAFADEGVEALRVDVRGIDLDDVAAAGRHDRVAAVAVVRVAERAAQARDVDLQRLRRRRRRLAVP